MQWRSIVVGLLVLRVLLNCAVWLVFGLGPSWGFDFPIKFTFNLHKIELLKDGDGATVKTNAWSQHMYDSRDPQAKTCSKISGNSPKKSYLSFFQEGRDEYDRKYSSFPDALKVKMRGMARDMFYFGYDNYMKFAFPEDELNPIACEGRGPDVLNPSNININDVLGNYSLTLIDVLDTLLVLGNVTEFHRAVKLVIDTVSFDKDSTVQVFEANIRCSNSL
ncbi:ER degradation-enhancing alpha-mannosidase-like protein 1 [Labeo rohita]|uniref:alpha-1,2-Mannosidase n=1 Tax=Labeo rohita TaxID=84645 RepID=A0ABQ8MM47_LABRO|nr:ER degradation-enhancing alpha-mannosidase-like protein 1 [Labeo rohita]